MKEFPDYCDAPLAAGFASHREDSAPAIARQLGFDCGKRSNRSQLEKSPPNHSNRNKKLSGMYRRAENKSIFFAAAYQPAAHIGGKLSACSAGTR